MIIMEATPCETVDEFADRMKAAAEKIGEPILGEFNEHTFQAVKGMTVDEIKMPWSETGWLSYFGDNRLGQMHNN